MTAHTINLQPGDTLTVTTDGAAPPPVDPPPVVVPPQPPPPEPIGDVTLIDATWGVIGRAFTRDYGPFGCNPFAIRFTVPADAVNDGRPRYISIAESGGPPTLRHAVLSALGGSFGAGIAHSYGKQVTINVGVGGVGAMGLTPGGTYYMNVRNWSPDAPGSGCTCESGSCDASVDCVW